MAVPMCDLERPFCTSRHHLMLCAIRGVPSAFHQMDQARGPRGFPTDAPSRPSGHGPAMAAVPCRGPVGPLFHSARMSAREGGAPKCRMPFSPAPKAPLSLRTSPTRCAKGTFQIAHRNREPVLKVLSYVQFGTSLLHIVRSGKGLSHIAVCTCLRARGRSGPPGVRKERRGVLSRAGECGEQGCVWGSRGAERRAGRSGADAPARPFLIGRSADLRGTRRMTCGRDST